MRFLHHGGLTPAALVSVRLCIAKIVFSPTNVRTATRAGGVSPPFFRRQTFALQPERGALLPAFVSIPPAVSRAPAAFLQMRFLHHGGLTPAALGAAVRRTEIEAFRKCVSLHHGGLTPAALVSVRSCIAKIVFSPTNVRTATRAGGVSPPWVRYCDCTGVREHTAGSLPRLCGCVPANAFPPPRRANARRSWLSRGCPGCAAGVIRDR
jgi:hypothetical protein